MRDGNRRASRSDVEAFRRVQHELVPRGAVVGRPFAEQPAEIAAGAGGVAAELARVYADAHWRCSIARW